MQKLYLLLRNNRQAGPFSLDELLAQDLKPFDLVWVEGRSAAWRYPGEIDSLKDFVPAVPVQSQRFEPISTEELDKSASNQQPVREKKWSRAKKIFVSLPKGTERRQQAIEEPLHSTSFHNNRFEQANASGETLRTNYSRSVDDIEETYTNWVVEKKLKKAPAIPKKELATAAGVLVLLFLGFRIFSSSGDSQEDTAAPAAALSQTRPSEPKESQTTAGPVEPDAISQSVPTPERAQKLTTAKKRVFKTVIQANPVETPAAVMTEDGGKNEMISEPAGSNSNSNEASAPAPERKKKFGQALKGIFSKKESSAEGRTGGPLEAVRRNESSIEAASAAQVDQLVLSDNAGGNWMMGVSGMKLTLHNKNEYKLERALVTVSYFDGNNELIEKKNLVFSNVAAGSKSTVAVPDHKFADHVQAKVTSANMKL